MGPNNHFILMSKLASSLLIDLIAITQNTRQPDHYLATNVKSTAITTSKPHPLPLRGRIAQATRELAEPAKLRRFLKLVKCACVIPCHLIFRPTNIDCVGQSFCCPPAATCARGSLIVIARQSVRRMLLSQQRAKAIGERTIFVLVRAIAVHQLPPVPQGAVAPSPQQRLYA